MRSGFTNEEFDIMVQQLLYQEPASFDMLCAIAQRTLESSVRRWCRQNPYLHGLGFDEDILQEIYMRLIKTTVSSFLLRQGVDGPVNRDPAGFRSWMFRVAKNLTIDFAAHIRSISRRVEVDPEEDPSEKPVDELLAAAVSVVLETNSGIYKTLTWLAQCVLIVCRGLTRIQANSLLVEQFSKRELQALWQLVLAGSEQIPWLHITDAQRQRIEQALAQPCDGQRTYAQMPFEAFFMKKGGKASISDWVNRTDSIIKRVTQNETLNG